MQERAEERMQSDRRIIRAKAKETAPFGWVARPTFQAVFFGDSMAQTQAVPLVDPRPLAPRSKRRALIEIAIAYGLILTVIWTPRPWQQWLWWAAVVAVLTMVGLSFESLSAMGLRAANFFRSLWVVGLALGLSGLAILLAAGMHTLHTPDSPILFVKSFWGYAIWAGAQQFLLQCFFLSRLLRLIPDRRSVVWVAAALFAIAHLPNPLLTVVTALWGATACLLYLRYRNLYPLMIAHAIFGIAIAITVPGPVDHNMRVGLGYLTYNRHMHAHGFHRTSL